MFPEHLQRRYGSKEGREGLAARLGLSIDPHSQDWEYEIADPRCFPQWLAVYQTEPLIDDEKWSLMEMLIQCVETIAGSAYDPVEDLSEWQAVAELLRMNPKLHASTIWYWSLFDEDDMQEEDAFQVTMPMRRLWTDVQLQL